MRELETRLNSIPAFCSAVPFRTRFITLFAALSAALFTVQVHANVDAGKDKSRRKPAGVIQREVRLDHARELLGKYYPTSAVRSGEKVKKINARVYEWTKTRLPKKFRKKHEQLAQAIIDESQRYGFDPVFIMSVIQGESSFNPAMLGKLDEIGLMQIRPATGEWIAKMYGLKYKGDKSLLDPVQNVRIGTAFLHHLRGKFDSHAQLYLAAYNMGARNVNEALAEKIWPKDYPSHVMKYYVEFYSEIDAEAKAAKKAEQKRPSRIPATS